MKSMRFSMIIGLAMLSVLTGCWLEPANRPQPDADDEFSRVWAGEYHGYGELTCDYMGFKHKPEDVVLRIHGYHHNLVSFEMSLTPTRDLAPRVSAGGVVRDTFLCRFLDRHADVQQVVDIYRARGNIYGGIQVLDYNDNVVWKLEWLNLRPYSPD